jgi:membrane protein implicated in regulation of membrane protease activity
MPTLFWIWLAMAVVFLIIELSTPTMIFFSFVGGSVAAGILTAFYPEAYYWQIGLFLVVSAILIPTLRRFAGKITKESAEKSNVDRMIGDTARVTKAIAVDQTGQVQHEGEVWMASADEELSVGEVVTIVSITGVRLHVKRKN